MANPFIQYLQDTRGELRHVAWPTRTQTIVYSILVAAISVGVSLYLGLFDFLFTGGLKNALSVLPQNIPTQEVQPSATTTEDSTSSSVKVTPITLPKTN